MNKVTTIAISIIVGTCGAFASVITLDPSMLPSNQGWDYSAVGLHSGTIETNVVSEGGSALSFNTTGQSLSGFTGGSILYRLSGVVDSSMPTTLEWASQTLAYEYAPSAGQNFGFSVGFSSDSYRYYAGINSGQITLFDGSGFKAIPIDTTEARTYRFETISGTSTYNFYIDNALEATVSARTSTTQNDIYFGDGTGGANSNVNLTALNFSQIPEPSTILLLSASGVFILFGRRRFRR